MVQYFYNAIKYLFFLIKVRYNWDISKIGSGLAMIFRKPYAFLIKNFRKIHLVLIILCAYIFYKHLQVYNFVKEYVELESYSAFLESIDRYTNWLSYLAILAVIVVSVLLLITLRRKDKPWKLYLVVLGEYVLMLFAFVMTTNFFHTYNDSTAVTEILMVRDLLMLASFAQYAVFIILFIRLTGLDLNKFSFQTDQEYLEMDSSDREEVEVSFEIDKHTIIRNIRKLRRNLGYFYLEHKFILNSLFAITFVFLIGYSYYYFGIVHKSYKVGQTFSASGYNIKIENVYVSDKNYRGEKLDGDNYIILDMKVQNNAHKRVMDTDRFHLINRNYDILSNNLYDSEFKDLGTPYSKREFQAGKTYDFLLIFKVDSKLDIHKFNLYYQEYQDVNKTYLRKIRLKPIDLRTIERFADVSLGIEQEISILNKKKSFSIDHYEIGTQFDYRYYGCSNTGCMYQTQPVVAEGNKKILKIDFSSTDFTGEEFVDFSVNYGRIKYKDHKGKVQEIPVKNALSRDAMNKSLYLIVPEEIEQSGNITFELTVRNHCYVFKLR